MAGGDELGRAQPVDITADRDDWDDWDERDERGEDTRFPRPEALPWTAAWALVSAGLLLFAYTGAGVVQEALVFLEESSGFAGRSASISTSIPPLVLSLLAGVTGRVALVRPVDEQRGWVRPLALAVSLLAALTATVFLGVLIAALVKHVAPQNSGS